MDQNQILLDALVISERFSALVSTNYYNLRELLNELENGSRSAEIFSTADFRLEFLAIGFPSQLLVENDGLTESSILYTDENQLPVSNQNMVDMGKKLLEAASENDIENCRLLMAGGAPFTGNWLGTTPLHAAAKAGHIETVELLLKAGIFRDAKTKVDRTALQMAAEEGHTDIAKMLLLNGAEVNSKDMLRMTALHWAVQHSHHEIVSLLLCHGADITAVNKFGKTPLDIACDNDSDNIIQLLQMAANQMSNNVSAIESETATQKLMSELDAEKRTSWKASPEEDALEKLTACASKTTSTEGVKILESHGISFLPVDNSTLLTSALECGQSISLTEAGKMALNQTKSVTPVVPNPVKPPPVKKIKVATPTVPSPRIITITAEQFLALAGRLQQQGPDGQGCKPMVVSLPKNCVLPALNRKVVGTAVAKQAINGVKATPISVGTKTTHTVSSLSEFLYGASKSIASPTKVVANPIKPVVPSSNTLSLPNLDYCLKSPTKSRNKIDGSPANSSLPPVLLTPIDMGNLGHPTAQDPPSGNPLANNTELLETAEEQPPKVQSHFFKSGLLKGSARTTPMALLCRKVKAAAAAAVTSPTIDSNAKPTGNAVASVNHDALSLGTCSDLFPDEPDSDHDGKSVWLSILEGENGPFSADNDEDLLDPARLAAQLASIRQAASQFSYTS